jgi:hypothetical protein
VHRPPVERLTRHCHAIVMCGRAAVFNQVLRMAGIGTQLPVLQPQRSDERWPIAVLLTASRVIFVRWKLSFGSTSGI